MTVNYRNSNELYPSFWLISATTTYVIGGVVAFLFVFFMFIGIWASRYTKVGPNQVLVISGRKHRMVDPDGTARDVGFRIVKGGGVFVWPVYEKVDILSLELLTIDVQQEQDVYTSKGVPGARGWRGADQSQR